VYLLPVTYFYLLSASGGVALLVGAVLLWYYRGR